MKKKYFGTDGIRGTVGSFPITADFMLKTGWAAGTVFKKHSKNKHRVLIGKDTRVSGYMFESALEAGLIAAGVDVFMLGPMPTPAIAYLTRAFRASAGIVISASHNSFEDNGIKFFSSDGYKLADEIELEIEQFIDTPVVTNTADKLGKAVRINDATGRYVEFCKASVPQRLNLSRYKIVVDCANGATYNAARKVFKELGASVTSISIEPDGFNINESCGSTHMENVCERVRQEKADFGIAFDGDGDRIGVIDDLGKILWGDQLLAILAEDVLLEQPGSTILGDVKASQGLFDRITALGGKPLMWKTGHSLIKNKMKEVNAPLAGEMSGHIFFNDRYFGFDDAIYAAIRLIDVVNRQRKNLSTIRSALPSVINTPELRLPCEGKNKFLMIEQVKEILQEYKDVEVCDIDGVRVSSKYGWWLIRASNTQEIIVARCEATSTEYLENIKAQLKAVLQKIQLPYPYF